MKLINVAYNIFLDDVRDPRDAFNYMHDFIYLKEYWVTVRSYDEFVKTITERFEKESEFPRVISFDHDLADEHYEQLLNTDKVDYNKVTEKTGYHCVQWLINFCIDNKIEFPHYLLHTMNPVGKLNMSSLIENYKRHEEKT